MNKDSIIEEILEDYDMLHHQDCDDSCSEKFKEQKAKQAIELYTANKVLEAKYNEWVEFATSSDVTDEAKDAIVNYYLPRVREIKAELKALKSETKQEEGE